MNFLMVPLLSHLFPAIYSEGGKVSIHAGEEKDGKFVIKETEIRFPLDIPVPSSRAGN